MLNPQRPSMARLPRFALAIELSLVLAEALLHASWLPLGGSHIAQIGICLGMAAVLGELHEALRAR